MLGQKPQVARIVLPGPRLRLRFAPIRVTPGPIARSTTPPAPFLPAGRSRPGHGRPHRPGTGRTAASGAAASDGLGRKSAGGIPGGKVAVAPGDFVQQFLDPLHCREQRAARRALHRVPAQRADWRTAKVVERDVGAGSPLAIRRRRDPVLARNRTWQSSWSGELVRQLEPLPTEGQVSDRPRRIRRVRGPPPSPGSNRPERGGGYPTGCLGEPRAETPRPAPRRVGTESAPSVRNAGPRSIPTSGFGAVVGPGVRPATGRPSTVRGPVACRPLANRCRRSKPGPRRVASSRRRSCLDSGSGRGATRCRRSRGHPAAPVADGLLLRLHFAERRVRCASGSLR